MNGNIFFSHPKKTRDLESINRPLFSTDKSSSRNNIHYFKEKRKGGKKMEGNKGRNLSGCDNELII